MKLSNKVRENLSKLLNKIDFIETSRNSHDAMEWLHGKIKGRRVVICLWNSCREYKKPVLQVNIYDDTFKNPVKSKSDLLDSYEIMISGKILQKRNYHVDDWYHCNHCYFGAL